ncbi:MAG: DUF192 domain-containing protein [Bryobacteraceae bacterium]|nr:DUF192 domain-containing protein [Bryobacteraceae bacterium]
MRRITVKNLTKSTYLADRAGVANTPETRNRGLLKHMSLEKGDGLWISPTQAVHMFFMKFALDLVYLDREKRVVKVRENVKPWRISAALRAKSVLELPVGTIAESRTSPGDQLEFINNS